MGFQENPYKHMKECDIYCSASSREGYSLVIGEAIILELPVIAINSCGSNELLNYGEYGILTDDDEVKLYNALKSMISDRKVYNYYKNQSIKQKTFFNSDDIKRKIEKVIG